jgi:hypothetical protein
LDVLARGKTPTMGVLPRIVAGRFASLAKFELKIDIVLLSCNIAQTSRYHWKERDEAFLPA